MYVLRHALYEVVAVRQQLGGSLLVDVGLGFEMCAELATTRYGAVPASSKRNQRHRMSHP